MSDDRTHPSDELQLLLDDRLSHEERVAVEAHLRDCSRCRSEFEALRQLKTAIRERLPNHEVPAELTSRVTRGLATESGAGGARRREGSSYRRALARGIAIAAGLLLVLAAWTLLIHRAGRNPVNGAASDFEALRSGRLTLVLATGDPPTLQQDFSRSGLPFATRVFDFGMMNYRLLGGWVHRLGGGPSALFAYQGSGGEQVVCQMYQGRLEALPSDFEERDHDGIRFRIYRRGDLTLVFWQEGEVVCVLTAEGPAEAAIQLAYAKALKV